MGIKVQVWSQFVVLLKLFPFFHNDRWIFTYCLPTTAFTLLIQTLEALKNLDL